MRLLGIQRGRQFSPGRHADNDRMILEATAAALQRQGCDIQLISEEDVGFTSIHAPVVFSMCQGARAHRILADMERQGRLIINRPTAAQNCHRAHLHAALCEDWGIFAPMVLLPTTGKVALPRDPAGNENGFWIKRGDVHATQADDVVRVRTSDQLRSVLDGFHRRRITQAVAVPHLPGEVIKFYGVVGSPFFRFYGELDSASCPLDLASARPSIERIVRRLGLEIYGGDAILSRDGQVRVIDVNDWPSFANFREEAAEAIAAHIYRRAEVLRDRRMGRPGFDPRLATLP